MYRPSRRNGPCTDFLRPTRPPKPIQAYYGARLLPALTRVAVWVDPSRILSRARPVRAGTFGFARFTTICAASFWASRNIFCISPSTLRNAVRSSRKPSTVITLSAFATSHRLKFELLLLDPHAVGHRPVEPLLVRHFSDLADGLFEPIREPIVEPEIGVAS